MRAVTYNWKQGVPILLLILILSNCAQREEITPPSQPLPQAMEPPQVMTKPQGLYHTVEKGETLWRIGETYNVSVDELARINRLPDASYLEVGQMLFIPQKGIRAGRSTPDAQLASLPREDDFIWPLNGTLLNHYGVLVDGTRNKGIDIKAAEGAAIQASRSGIVSFAGEEVKGYGKVIILDHRDDFQTVYAYNSRNLVHEGERVRQGQIIAHVGKSGRTRISAIHFEIRKSSRPNNPLLYLKR